MKTDPDTGRPEAHVSNRRLGVQLGASAQLYRPEAMCAEDFRSKDDKLCCPRQIAELLCEDLGKVAMALEALEPDFGRRGVHHGAAPEVRGGAGLQPRGGTTATPSRGETPRTSTLPSSPFRRWGLTRISTSGAARRRT